MSPEVDSLRQEGCRLCPPHPSEFRQRAVDLARSGVKPVAAIAKELSSCCGSVSNSPRPPLRSWRASWWPYWRSSRASGCWRTAASRTGRRWRPSRARSSSRRTDGTGSSQPAIGHLRASGRHVLPGRSRSTPRPNRSQSGLGALRLRIPLLVDSVAFRDVVRHRGDDVIIGLRLVDRRLLLEDVSLVRGVVATPHFPVDVNHGFSSSTTKGG